MIVETIIIVSLLGFGALLVDIGRMDLQQDQLLAADDIDTLAAAGEPGQASSTSNGQIPADKDIAEKLSDHRLLKRVHIRRKSQPIGELRQPSRQHPSVRDRSFRPSQTGTRRPLIRRAQTHCHPAEVARLCHRVLLPLRKRRRTFGRNFNYALD